MYYWRVTKYNQLCRDEQSRYKREEWTSIGDIGKFYREEELTVEKYQIIENAYVEAVILAMEELEIKSLKVKDLETREYMVCDGISDSESKNFYEIVQESTEVSIENIPYLVKLILREILWAKLESDDLCVHFGYDYYMYFVAKKELKKSAPIIEKKGLFIEDFKSPYLENE